MFTFILFLLLSGLCFIIYAYLTNKIVLLRKQIMLLAKQNDELKNKINKLIEEQNLEKHKNSIPILLQKHNEFDLEKEE